ncbi:unnamed protein product [Ectocarpus sp. 12 AP-2014]
MGGIKRSLLAAGLLATTSTKTTSAYLFPAPSGAGLSSVATSRNIEDRKSSVCRLHGSPSPRMSTMSPAAEGTEASAPTQASRAADLVSSASGAQLASSLIFPSITRQPRPGIIARDGTEDLGMRERDDGKSPDFEVNLGKVISTLREDYPRIFFDPPAFDIFTEEIELRDPTGVAFRGISNYKRVFATLRFFRQTFMNDATTTFRLTYDWSKQQVRVTWNLVLQLKARQRPIYVDGISAYHINSDGLAYRHELETVVVNGRAVEPPFAYAWINLPAWVSRGAVAKPAGAGAALPTPHAVVGGAPTQLFEQQQGEADDAVGAMFDAARTNSELRGDYMQALSTVLMMDTNGVAESGGGEGAAAGATPDESDGDGSGEGGAAAAAAATAAANQKRARAEKKKKNDAGGWFGSKGAELACETSWDCTGGMVCCDFVLLKVCCSNGIRQPKFGELIPSLVPIPGRGRNENDNPKRIPPAGGSSRPPQRPGTW